VLALSERQSSRDALLPECDQAGADSALDDLKESRSVNQEVRQRNLDFLKTAAKPAAVLLLMVAPPVEALVEATKTK